MALRHVGLAAALSCLALAAGCGDATEVDSPAITDVAGNPSPPIVGADDPVELTRAVDNTWVAIAGTIVSASPNRFVLDYGPDTMTVEMDDLDPGPEGGALRGGDKVVVRGRVDRDWGQKKTIEASSVFVRSLSAFFYANSADEETTASLVSIPRQDSASDAIGTVTNVEGRELTIGRGPNAVRIDTAQMSDNPLDEAGNPKIAVGDRVYVWGNFDIDPQERPEVSAIGIIELLSARGTGTAGGKRS